MPKPIGVLACNDLRGIQVVTAAQASGFLVPEEVAVIGVNNDQVRCELSYPRLSSVATNSVQSGFLAAELLDALMRGAAPPAATVRVEPVGVVTRHSSDVLAIDDRHVATALSFIREHACRGVSVDAVLSRVPMTRSRLEKGFRRFLGRSPQVEIRRVQVAKAKQLLVETDYPLKHISELTGFEHVEYLSVVFKRFTGVSPGQFRKKAQAGERN